MEVSLFIIYTGYHALYKQYEEVTPLGCIVLAPKEKDAKRYSTFNFSFHAEYF